MKALLDAVGPDSVVPPLLLLGAAGVGKTRLLQEALGGSGAFVLRVTCPPGGGAFFHIPVSLACLLFELPIPPSGEQIRDALRQWVQRLPPEDPKMSDFLGLLLGSPLPSRYQGLDPRSARLSAFAAGRALLQSPSLHPQGRPLVLVVEDLQWADAGSLEFLEHLTRVPLPRGTALVATSRPCAYPDPKRGRGDGWKVVPLEPLLAADSRDVLLGITAGRSLPPLVESALVERAGGLPIGFEEGFLALSEGGLLLPEQLHYEFVGGPEALEPAAGSPLGARRFSDAEREVLAAIAVLGEDATEPLLDECLGRPTAAELARLVGRRMVQRWVGPYSWSPVKYSFLHPSDHEMALAAAPPAIRAAMRAAMHRWAYERLERGGDLGGALPARGLWHAREAGLVFAAAVLAERVGDVAREANLPAAAVEAYGEALSLRAQGAAAPVDLDRREWTARGLEVQLKHAEALLLLGRADEATRDIATVRVGYADLGDKKRLCRAKLTLARAFERVGELDRMLEEASDAATIASEAGDGEFIARAQATVADALERRARYDEALAHAQEAEGRLERLAGALPADVRRAALAGVGLTVARVHADQGRQAEALAAIEKAIPLARSAEAPRVLSLALELSARLLRETGDLARALAAQEEALSIAESRGDRIAVAADWTALGHLRREACDAEGAARAFQAAHLACREMGDRAGAATALANLGHLAFDQGELAAAVEAFREAAVVRAGIHDRVGGIAVRLAWAEAEAERGAAPGGPAAGGSADASAEGLLEEALASAREMGARAAEARGLILLGRMRLREGRQEEALAAHEAARDLACAAAAAREHLEATVELGFDALAKGDAQAAAVRLEVASRMEGVKDPRARVRLLLLDASVRLASGEEALPAAMPRGALPLAEEALTLAHRTGLRRLVPSALLLCARAAGAAGDAEAAAAFRARAEDLARQMGLPA